jgi:GT2 family glycosyltransferase
VAALRGGAGEGAAARLAAVVPTVGASPHLERCLEALRREGLETVVVHQGAGEPPAAATRLADRLLRLPANLGFAAATNLGIAATSGEYVATVNDDAVVEPGWAAALAAALDADPRAAAAQGSNLQLADPARLDGRGLAWNRWWQAVQVGHGEPAARPTAAAEEVFGASATAALYRRSALQAVASETGIFDERLGAYYEDADLACRLRRAGWSALWVPAARALHAGSVTGDRRRRWRLAHIYGNRWAVAARCLGRRFPVAVGRMAVRDLADLAGALGRADLAAAAGIAAGWARAARLLPGSIHRGPAVATVCRPEPE